MYRSYEKKNLFVSTAVHGKMFLVTKILKIYELSMLLNTKTMNVLSDIRRPLDYLEHQRPNMSTGKTSLRTKTCKILIFIIAMKRFSGYLKRPEILETVYSVEVSYNCAKRAELFTFL